MVSIRRVLVPCAGRGTPNRRGSDCGSAAAFRGPDWPVMCVRPADVTKQLRRHQSLASVHYLSPLWVGCISSTRATDPAQSVGTAAGPAGPGVARLTDDKPSYCPTLLPRRPHQVDFLARQWGRGAVPSSARPVCSLPGGLAPGLDVRDLAQILVAHVGAELPKLLRGGLASVRRHAPGRLDQAAARPPAARRPRRRSPAQARSPEHSLSVPASSPTVLYLAKLTPVKMKSTVDLMKRYGPACAIASPRDVVGERWSLLLVRELTFGPRRYRDLATGLPGIPSNVLAGGLKDLQAAGVVTRRTLPAPTDVTVYELTDAGRALRPALNDLLDWGLRYGPQPSQDDEVQPGWALLGAAGRATALPGGQTCELRGGPAVPYLSPDPGQLDARRGPTREGDAAATLAADTRYRLA